MSEPGIIGFATLLIGVVTGPHQIELMVGVSASEVRVLLDRAEAGRLVQAPWHVTLDFGPTPIPHLVQAIAFSRDGMELGQAAQWVNLPRPGTDLSLVLERDAEQRPAAVRLAWESPRGSPPTVVRVALDGQALAVLENWRAPLPPMRLGGTHFLRVEAEFGPGQAVSRELVFGGAYNDTAATALTAVPVVVPSPRATLRPAEVVIQATSGVRPDVVAVDEGAARVAAVVDSQAIANFREAGRTGINGRRVSDWWMPADSSCNWLAKPPQPGADVICGLDPRPQRLLDGVRERWVFTPWEASGVRVRDLVPILTRASFALWPPEDQALADAVANAGLLAANGAHRRAVVLVVDGPHSDGSTLRPEHAREYLRALGVPLYIWTPTGLSARNGVPGWGSATDISTCAKLRRASRRLAEDLARQRIVWVAGEHLPLELLVSGVGVRRAE